MRRYSRSTRTNWRKILTAENGKLLADARAYDVQFLVEIFRFLRRLGGQGAERVLRPGPRYSSVVLEPFGVVGAIIPFNWPPIHTGGKVAAALAVGNTVVVKPAAVAADDHAHRGAGQHGPARGCPARDPRRAEPGQALVANPLVAKVSFTGSTGGGIAVAKAAAQNVTPVTLERGGNNAFAVFDDADLDQAVRDALEGGFFNKGEACTAASRVLVQRGIAEEFTKAPGSRRDRAPGR